MNSTDQDESILASLGEGSNAIVWPRTTVDEDEEVDAAEAPDNQRLMRIGSMPCKNVLELILTTMSFVHLGDDTSDLDLSDPGSESSSEDESEYSDDGVFSESNFSALASSMSSTMPLGMPTGITASADARLESEFKHEVELSLERAFAEGHSVDNAAVELKTLRMASNVPLVRVREAVVGAIVERITIVEGGAVPQRKEIANVIERWGSLINQIGGVDAVETICVLQVSLIT